MANKSFEFRHRRDENPLSTNKIEIYLTDDITIRIKKSAEGGIEIEKQSFEGENRIWVSLEMKNVISVK